ncbi:MAG: flagellar motor protein MotB [Desulfobacteria bacterium]|nr:OmpA family protein [Deltaproteobacteria bacterium]
MSSQKSVIIKHVKKRAEEGGHGGSWKVAYADFVTAMMAFFLLMWLITMVAPEKRARVATYFKHFSIYEKSGSSFMDKNAAILNETGGEISVPKEFSKGMKKEVTREELKEHLRSGMEKQLADVKDQVIVEVFEGGVRIQLVDKEGREIFPLGSAEPTPIARKIFKVITGSIKDVPNKIAIEGHTDALTYSSSRYTNWELSTERASAARKELEEYGLDPDRLARVSGFAATEPLIKGNPSDPRNRRISIILQYPTGNR